MKYPCLTIAIEYLAGDAGFRCKPRSRWDWPEDYDLDLLEGIAQRFSVDELENFAAGGDEDIKILSMKYRARSLWHFISEVFDGDLTSSFFQSTK